MREGDIKLFHSKPLLYRMVNLRLCGYGTTSLSILFDCHRSSIEYQLQRYEIATPANIYIIERIISTIIRYLTPKQHFEMIDGEKINIGKTYAEYVKESEAAKDWRQRKVIIRIT